ncbi:hypothetical protein KEM56_002977 [Ascosphaera pollenicola]|nr:hypothetical protein KEM56_002977 [Ascosphaera pollenicola]
MSAYKSRPQIVYKDGKFEEVDPMTAGQGDEAVQEIDPLPVPVPSEEYLAQSARKPERLDQPRRLFIVLDLNRTLIYRAAATYEFIRRPYLEPFMETIVKEHNAMIWTTSKSATVKRILPVAFKGRVRRKLCEVLDRSSFGLNRIQFDSKTQVYKELDKVWGDKTLQRKREEQTKEVRKKLPQTTIIHDFWNQSNTVLIDDSWQKAVKQPYNFLEVPALTERNAQDEVTLPMILRQLRVLSHYNDVSCKIRQWIEIRNRSYAPKPDGRPHTLSQDDYNWFWNRIMVQEEKELGLDPYVFPPPKESRSDAGGESESETSDEENTASA